MSSVAIPTLPAQGFSLRAARPEDGLFLLSLERDAEIHRMFGGSATELRPYAQPDAEHWAQRLISHPCAWVIDAGDVIGEARLDRIDMRDKRANFAIGILNPAWLGKGIGTQAGKLVLNFAFRNLGLHRVSLRVLAYNDRAIRAYQNCGFLIEGREREAALVDGVWRDDLIMGVLDREFSAAVSGA